MEYEEGQQTGTNSHFISINDDNRSTSFFSWPALKYLRNSPFHGIVYYGYALRPHEWSILHVFHRMNRLISLNLIIAAHTNALLAI